MKLSKRKENPNAFIGFSLEMDLILSLLRDDRIIEKDFELFKSKKINWEKFLKLAIHHRVYPMLYDALKKVNTLEIPELVMKNLESKYQQNVYSMLKFAGEQQKIGEAFLKNNIQALFLKGPNLALDIYGDISLRTSRDIDLLVPDKQLDQVEKILLSAGYIKEDSSFFNVYEKKWRVHHDEYFHREKNIRLEVHWRLHNNLLIEPIFKDLWSRRRSISWANTEIQVLGREDLFLYLVTHGARHGWFRIRWLVDIDRMIRYGNLNWKVIHFYSNKYKYNNVFGQSILLTNKLLLTQIPENSDFCPLIKSDNAKKITRLALEFIRNKKMNQTLSDDSKSFYYYNFALQYSLVRKIKYLLIMLCPTNKDTKILPLPEVLHILYFPLRPFFIIGRSLGLLKNNS